jgi:hypothetical protein
MTNVVQVTAISFALALVTIVLELVRRRKLTEEHSLIWIAGALALLALSVWRNLLDSAARVVGVYYPPALLLLALTGFVFLVSLYFSVVISRQRQDIERMVEELALLEAEVRRLRESGRSVPAVQMMPDASRQSGEPAEPRRLPRQQHVAGIQPDDESAA